MSEDLGLGLAPGDPHYRAFVGPPEDYDLITAMTFGLLTSLGLRQHHRLLDIGCGSLRIGRVLIPYLNAERYVGIEPNRWLIEEGVAKEVGQDSVALKRPTFCEDDSTRPLRGGEPIDFAVAQSIFSHCGMDLLDHWLGEVAAVLGPSGALVATFLIGESDPEESGWIYPSCVQFRPETMEAQAARHGFSFQILDWRHPRQTWGLFARPGFDVSWLNGRPLGWNTWLEHTLKAG